MLLIAGRVIHTLLLPGSGWCFCGIELNHPFSTSGLGRELFRSSTPALFY